MADHDGRFTVENERLEAAAAAAAGPEPENDGEDQAGDQEPKAKKGGLAGPSKASG